MMTKILQTVRSKRTIAMLLALAMVIGLLPMTAFATSDQGGSDDTTAEETKYTISATFDGTLSGLGEGLYGPEATIMKDADGKMAINIQLLPGINMSDWSTVYYNDMKVYTDHTKETEIADLNFKAATGYSDLGYLSFTLTDAETQTYYIETTMNHGETVRTGLVTLDWSTLKEILIPVGTPVITPSGGELEPTDTITITCPTDGAKIYYVLGDGWTNPFDYDGNLVDEAVEYTGPFTIDDATVVTAQAAKDGMANSASVDAKFTVSGVSKKLLDFVKFDYVEDSNHYNLITLYTGNSLYEDMMKPSTGMPTVSEYYILVEQGDVFERHLWNGGIGGFFADYDYMLETGADNFVKILLAKDKWNADQDITLTVVAKGYDSKKLILSLDDETITSQENTTPDAGTVFENRADVEEGKTYTATFTAIKTGTNEESMLAGFFEPTAKVEIGPNGTTNITFRNMVMPEQLQDFGLQGSGDWTGAVTDGTRTETVEDALFTIPVSTVDFKNGFFLGGVNVLAMGGAISNNGVYDKYTSVEITFADEIVEGFQGFESSLNGLTEEKKVNRALMTIYGLDDNKDGYISKSELAAYEDNTYDTALDLSSGKLSQVYSSFDDLKIKDISWVVHLPKTMTSIHLTGHSITAIDNEFKGFTQLETLNLRANAIIGITDGAFSDLANLRDLGLSTNGITKVTSGMFTGLVHLADNENGEFSLAQNNIQTIEAGAFSDLGKVKNFFLYDNKLTSIPKDSFTGMDRLERLEIYDNQLKEIPADIQSMDKLTYLDLHSNEITEIGHGLIPLTYLNLSNNFIAHLPDTFSTTMAEADTIRLEGNDLKALPADFVRMTLANDAFQNVYVGNPIDVNLLKDLTADELEQVGEILKISGVSSKVVNMKIIAADKKVTFTQDLSAFDLYFWSYAMSKDSHKTAINAALGKDTIDSVDDYKTFRNHNLPSFSAEDIATSIFGGATNAVTDYTITTSLQKQVSGNWITISTSTQSGGEEAKTGSFTDNTMKKDNQYRLVKTVGNHSVIAYATATITEVKPEVDGTLKDGTYTVPVSVKKYGATSQNSMANGAVVGKAKAELSGDTITYTLTFKGMKLQGLYGHLTNFWHYAAADTELNNPMFPDSIEKYWDKNIDGDTAEFPSNVVFTYEGSTEDSVNIYVEVDAMNQLGEGKQNAVLVFDWSKAKADGGASSGGSSGGVAAPKEEEKEEITEPGSPEFSDVKATDWYADAVAYVVEAGLFKGTSDTEFAPNATMTRAMVWTVLARMSEVDTDGGETWYTIGQNWAKENGISDGANPEGDISREQLVTMLYRYAKAVAVESKLAAFTDADNVADWAIDAMKWAVSAQLVQGNTETTLNPTGNATRAEVATILMRFAEMQA